MHIIAHGTEYRWHGLILYWISVALGRMQIKRRKWLTHIHSQIRNQKSESRKRKIEHFASIHSFAEVEIVVVDVVVVCTHFLFLVWFDLARLHDRCETKQYFPYSIDKHITRITSVVVEEQKQVPGIVQHVLLRERKLLNDPKLMAKKRIFLFRQKGEGGRTKECRI